MTGRQLQSARKKLKLSQQELSALLGVVQSTVSRWEREREDAIPAEHAVRVRALERQARNGPVKAEPPSEELIELQMPPGAPLGMPRVLLSVKKMMAGRKVAVTAVVIEPPPPPEAPVPAAEERVSAAPSKEEPPREEPRAAEMGAGAVLAPRATAVPGAEAVLPASVAPSPASVAPSPASVAPNPASAAPSPASVAPNPASAAPSPASAAPSPASAAPGPVLAARVQPPEGGFLQRLDQPAPMLLGVGLASGPMQASRALVRVSPPRGNASAAGTTAVFVVAPGGAVVAVRSVRTLAVRSPAALALRRAPTQKKGSAWMLHRKAVSAGLGLLAMVMFLSLRDGSPAVIPPGDGARVSSRTGQQAPAPERRGGGARRWSPMLADHDSEEPVSFGEQVPSTPFENQKRPPCKRSPRGAQVDINGGCYVEIAARPPCPEEALEHGDRCYIPVAARQPATPTSSRDCRADPGASPDRNPETQ